MGTVITIGREFGSGGREFGRRLAEELGIEYYDKEIITEISKHTSLSENYIKSVIESRPHSLYPITVGHSINYMSDYTFRHVQSIFSAQNQIINELSEASDCVIVGRCADYILREKKPYRIFVYADIQTRIERCIRRSSEDEHYTEKQMKRHIREIDRQRAKYYNFYTGQKWGDKAYYDLCVNTTGTSIKEIVPLIAKMFK